MALVVKDRVQETTLTVGTISVVLTGAVTGFQTFSSAIGNGNTTYYTIQGDGEWEVGIGTVGIGTLSRDTVLESSNAGSLVNFSAGSKFVFCTYPAEKSVDTETAQTLTNKTISGSSNTLSNISYTSLTTGAPSWDSSGNINSTGNITLDNSSADGAQLTLKSSGYSNWNLDNYSGRFRAYYNATEYFTIDTSGNVGIGTSSPSVALDVQSSGEGFYLSRDGGNAPDIRLRMSRGTFASKTASASGDLTGQVHFQGYDGTNYLDRAMVGGIVDGAVSTNNVPTALRFQTGSTSAIDRLKISSSGNFTAVIPSGSTLYPAFWCRAWVNFNGTGTISIRASGNVSSITDNGVGYYEPNFTNAMPDANYCTQVTGSNVGADGRNGSIDSDYGSQTTGSVAVSTANGGGIRTDVQLVCVAVFR